MWVAVTTSTTATLLVEQVSSTPRHDWFWQRCHRFSFQGWHILTVYFWQAEHSQELLLFSLLTRSPSPSLWCAAGSRTPDTSITASGPSLKSFRPIVGGSAWRELLLLLILLLLQRLALSKKEGISVRALFFFIQDTLQVIRTFFFIFVSFLFLEKSNNNGLPWITESDVVERPIFFTLGTQVPLSGKMAFWGQKEVTERWISTVWDREGL